MDSDGSRPSSFVATFRPFRFLDGWGIATPTSDHPATGSGWVWAFCSWPRASSLPGADQPPIGNNKDWCLGSHNGQRL
jgi:hypothetical protein